MRECMRLTKERDQLRSENHKNQEILDKVLSQNRELLLEIDRLKTESNRLKKIIAKQLSEEDDLGYEYTYVICLKEENQRLKAENESLKLDARLLAKCLHDYPDPEIIHVENQKLRERMATAWRHVSYIQHMIKCYREVHKDKIAWVKLSPPIEAAKKALAADEEMEANPKLPR